MTKEELFKDLNNTWVRLGVSKIAGIGVFALRDIPKGCRGMFSYGCSDWIEVDQTEIDTLPTGVKEMIESYCIHTGTKWDIPNYGFKFVDLVNFLNDSDNPNIISINDGEEFEAIRDIKNGEELFVSYKEISD